MTELSESDLWAWEDLHPSFPKKVTNWWRHVYHYFLLNFDCRRCHFFPLSHFILFALALQLLRTQTHASPNGLFQNTLGAFSFVLAEVPPLIPFFVKAGGRRKETSLCNPLPHMPSGEEGCSVFSSLLWGLCLYFVQVAASWQLYNQRDRDIPTSSTSTGVTYLLG